MEEVDINVNVPRSHLFIVMLILFLLAGFTIGYLVGNSVMNKRWNQYSELYREKINRECVCEGNIFLEGFEWMEKK